MSIELIWESTTSLLVEYSGQVTGSEAMASSLAMSDDPRFEHLETIIIDSSSLQQTIASDRDIDKIAAVSHAQAKSKPQMDIAFIMGPDEAAQSLAAFYQFLMEKTGWTIELFYTETEAREWLSRARLQHLNKCK